MPRRLLDQIDAPDDLKALSHDELTQVAQDVRDTIISVITERGGHLASNLGVVELTLALHRVFDSPNDSLVWDTTNQTYTHKLVTGRRDEFQNIRLEGGLSGFGEPSESPHDTLCAGHAGTGLSIALGIAEGAANQRTGSWTVAVVGDGAMTSGSSFEALNNIVHLNPEKFIVVLNDNGMSISENIGFLTNWRKRLITHPEFEAMIGRMRTLLRRMPKGDLAYELVRRFKTGLAGLIVPTMLWTEMGFQYLGPVDGHDFKQLEETLRQARNAKRRVPLVHVVTHKGHGYEPAEDDPVKFHQPSSPLGEGPAAPTYSKVFAQTLARVMRDDESVVGISAAMLEGTGLVDVRSEFPDRVFDVGIAEQHAVSLAAGMASNGLNPFVSIYSTFLQRAFDQVVHDICISNLPVTLIADRAGIVGEDGKTHHGAFDLSYLRCLPNAVVAAPMDENELQHLIYTAYRHRGPFAIRIARELPPARRSTRNSGSCRWARAPSSGGRRRCDIRSGQSCGRGRGSGGKACRVRHRVRRGEPDLREAAGRRSDSGRGGGGATRRHGGRERAGGRVRLGRAGSTVPGRHGGRIGAPHRDARLIHRARDGGGPAPRVGAGRRGDRPAVLSVFFSEAGSQASGADREVAARA